MSRQQLPGDQRAGAFVGLAIGDAAGWPSRIHRSHLLPAWTRRLRRDLDTHAETEDVTTLPVPFALNQSPEPLRLGPSDDAEWVAWTARWLSAHSGDITRVGVHDVWRDAHLPRGRIAVATAADGLRRGIEPPATGHDNPHHFDDSAAVRAVAIGAAFSDPKWAAQVAEWDAEVTNGGDGVSAARAMAAAVSDAIAGASVQSVVDTALGQLPDETKAGRDARQRIDLCAAATTPMDAAALLDDSLDTVYSYGVAAAETVSVAIALTAAAARAGSAPGETIAAAACLPRLADSAPALTGALAGAIHGFDALPPAWVERVRRLAGCCLPELEGEDLVELARRLHGGVKTKENT